MKTSTPRRGKALRLEKKAVKQTRLIEAIQLWAKQHGGIPPRVADWRKIKGTGWPSYLTVIRYFGSWDEAILRAGFQPRGRGRPIEDI